MSTITERPTASPVKSRSIRLSGSVRVWIALVAYLAAAKLILTVVFGETFADPAQAALFRRYGFLAAILLRVGFYFVWHTLYIH